MRLYQKQVEKFLNKEYEVPFEEFLSDLKSLIPGKAEVIKVETVNDEKFGEIEVYNLFNIFDEEANMSEDEWNKTCDVFLEFWKMKGKNGKFIIQ